MRPAERVAQPRYQWQVGQVHAAGPRVVAELLAELADVTDGADVLDAMLTRYAGLELDMLRAAGGDCFPPVPLREVA